MAEGLRRYFVRVPLKAPVRGVLHRDATLIGGNMGWGEASPMPGYPVAASKCEAASFEAAMLGLPDPVRHVVPVSALIPHEDPAAAIAAVRSAVEDGYSTIKLKIGDPDDVERVAAVRQAVGPDVAIRLDANGAWDLATARTKVQAMARFDPEFIEEPVAGLEDMARLRPDVTVPIAADESVRDLLDARRLAELGAADVLVLKVQACGGALKAMHWAEDAGVPIVVTSMMETSIGLAAGVALAASLPELSYACGLGTGTLLAGDVVKRSLIPEGGALVVRQVEPDVELLERYGVEGPG